MADRDDEEAVEELARTLAELRDELDAVDRRGPTPLELLRMTERHTIPTLVATLEATIEGLELVRATLRLIDPEANVGSGDGVGDAATASATRLLADLRGALDGVDVDPAREELVTEARELSAEVERRLDEAGAGLDDETPTSGVDIAVRSEGDAGDPLGDDDAPDVDVEAELRSLKEEFDED